MLLLPVMYPGITCERSKDIPPGGGQHPEHNGLRDGPPCSAPSSDGMSLIPDTAWEMDSL